MELSNIKAEIGKCINKHEIYRYLGYKSVTPDEQILKVIDEVLNEIILVSEPKSVYKIFYCQIENDAVLLFDCGLNDNNINENIDKLKQTPQMVIKTKNLADNLRQCSKVVLLAATIGIGADKLLNKYELMNMTKASVTQACAAAYIETFCNVLQEEIRQKALTEGLYLRPRFSPGSGDFKLEAQKHIFEILECTKRIGLTLTQSLLMYPTKSVTAIIGLTPNKQSCHIDKCKQCNNIGCEFRNE